MKTRNIDYEKILRGHCEVGRMARLFKDCWDLKGCPIVSELEFEERESKLVRGGRGTVARARTVSVAADQKAKDRVTNGDRVSDTIESQLADYIETNPGTNDAPGVQMTALNTNETEQQGLTLSVVNTPEGAEAEGMEVEGAGAVTGVDPLAYNGNNHYNDNDRDSDSGGAMYVSGNRQTPGKAKKAPIASFEDRLAMDEENAGSGSSDDDIYEEAPSGQGRRSTASPFSE